MRSVFDLGLVDYVSEEGATAFDRALKLADVMSMNGEPHISFVFRRPRFSRMQAPLALRAAKQAISRAQDLSLESGELHYFPHPTLAQLTALARPRP
jgi:methylglutaconyl-CoA hydratase